MRVQAQDQSTGTVPQPRQGREVGGETKADQQKVSQRMSEPAFLRRNCEYVLPQSSYLVIRAARPTGRFRGRF
jgi:hypothetical protein